MNLHIISDTHTKHRGLNLPGGEVLIHAGDFMGHGWSQDEVEDFFLWFNGQKYKHKILIAGNHERIFEENPNRTNKLLREFPAITYLQDEGCTIDGINFYGSPWTPAFCNWAFQLHNDYEDTEIWKKIPKDTDVLITHGPAYGMLDQYEMPTGDYSDKLGSKGLRNWIDDNNPKVHICGHIHTGQGVMDGYDEVTTHINAACLGETYKFTNPKEYIEWTV
jgi:predicted phosphodiesterase